MGQMKKQPLNVSSTILILARNCLSWDLHRTETIQPFMLKKERWDSNSPKKLKITQTLS